MEKKLSKTAKSRKQLDRLEEKLARALADYDNLEKRVAAQRREWAVFAKLEVIDKLLPIFDDLNRAEIFCQDKGLRLVADQFRALLRSEGVEEVDTVGDFNPEQMDCVALVPGKANTVVTVVQKGYRLGGKTIRPAKVEVGAGPRKKLEHTRT